MRVFRGSFFVEATPVCFDSPVSSSVLDPVDPRNHVTKSRSATSLRNRMTQDT